MEKTKKEIRNRWITAFLSVLFFVIACKVTAQETERSYLVSFKTPEKSQTVTYILKNPMILYEKYLGNDSLSHCYNINIYADKVFDTGADTISFYVRFPADRNPEDCVFRVGYADGTFSVLSRWNTNVGYAEYYIHEKDRIKMKTIGINGITFDYSTDKKYDWDSVWINRIPKEVDDRFGDFVKAVTSR